MAELTAPDDCVAVVLTHRRPRLAQQVVESLLEGEGFAEPDVILVVNGEGGLADRGLEARLTVVRLDENLGPAGGFRAGLEAAFERPATRWAYLCEDDVGLFALPSPRVGRLVDEAAAWERSSGGRLGGVVAYGRDVDRRTGRTIPHDPISSAGLEPVEVAAWGASLVSRRVVDADVLPDPAWFFAYEDHDFWLRVRAAGLEVTLDATTARAVNDLVSGAGREAAIADHRPTGATDPWRAFYQARNFVELSRRHGDWRWTLDHVMRTARRIQVARGGTPFARAALNGLASGLLGRLGRDDRYLPGRGEL